MDYASRLINALEDLQAADSDDEQLVQDILDLPDDDLNDIVHDYLGRDFFRELHDEEMGLSPYEGEDSILSFGSFTDITEGRIRVRKKPGEVHIVKGKIRRGPRHKYRLTGADRIKASRRMKRLRRTGKFRTALKRSMRKLRRSAKYKALKRRVARMRARHKRKRRR